MAAQQEAARLAGEDDLARKAMLGRAYARAHRRDEASDILNDLFRRRRTDYVPASWLAYVYVGLGETRQAIDWLERGYEERETDLAFLNTYPLFDPLRSEPRFQDLLRRMNFPSSEVK